MSNDATVAVARETLDRWTATRRCALMDCVVSPLIRHAFMIIIIIMLTSKNTNKKKHTHTHTTHTHTTHERTFTETFDKKRQQPARGA